MGFNMLLIPKNTEVIISGSLRYLKFNQRTLVTLEGRNVYVYKPENEDEMEYLKEFLRQYFYQPYVSKEGKFIIFDMDTGHDLNQVGNQPIVFRGVICGK